LAAKKAGEVDAAVGGLGDLDDGGDWACNGVHFGDGGGVRELGGEERAERELEGRVELVLG